MKALEKAARIIDETVFELPNVYPYTIRREEAFAKARAVISSIEVDDAMVEAALGEAGQIVNAHNRSRMHAALKAALHSILVDGEGK